uniref:LIM zinc-binding domain-containing protein n=1 Tax=Globodera pallida TaxID=36090 RepID=A0A183CBM4_GLOPA
MAPFIPQLMSKELCYRCGKPVYPTDKVGPLKDGAFFHQGCFKCYLCGTRLALKTYCNNRKSGDDREVYCRNHVPNALPHDPALPLPSSPSNGIDANAYQQQQQMQCPRRSADAGLHDMKIAHAMKVTQAVKPYPKIKHGGAKYIVDYDAQTRLELLHRQDEDKLYNEFNEHRQKELQRFEEETREEWEKALTEFARRYEYGHAASREKEQLLRNLTLRKERKLETITSKRKERERMRTAELVDEQAKEMMDLFRQARTQHQTQQKEQRECDVEETTSSCSGGMPSYPATPPPPMPPSCSKRHIYTDTVVFQQIDQVAVSVANQDLHSFTELIRTLISGARSDVDKARAIYRWITVKNLNMMNFDNDLDKDTPMGLLRGIKYGTESYHVLFKRLCSYAGLHCTVIKGFSKSAGYQPGLGFDDSRFRNTWNAVFLDGSWRFVQCNWGARHLVNAKENVGGKKAAMAQNGYDKNGPGGVGNNLRYEYDDHYFMTDPEEMIYEFFPDEPQWQLLPRPVSLKQFEQLPFVRSLFFRYGLRFSDPRLPAVVRADKTGAVSIAITLGTDALDSLIFHYNLRFFDTDDAELDGGLGLKRFVMQSSMDDSVVFRVHVPTTRPLLLDIFANSVSPEHYLTGQPIKFKSVCKFKIVCDSLQHIMVPLPECASGEWGPAKAFRLFGLVPRTHEEPIINCDQYCEIRFRVMKPLTELVANLHRNGMESRHLQKCVQCSLDDDEVVISLAFPDEGQYGMDIYTRDAHQRNGLNGRQMLTHCCKYLINARVD